MIRSKTLLSWWWLCYYYQCYLLLPSCQTSASANISVIKEINDNN